MVHGANMGPIWGRQDPGGPHFRPMNFAIWDVAGMRSLMISNMFMVNDNKTEFLTVRNKQQLQRVSIPFIQGSEDHITHVMPVLNLDVSNHKGLQKRLLSSS